MKLRIFILKHKRFGMLSQMIGYDEDDAFRICGKSPEEWEIVWKNED
jgi:hypothetical protein